MCTVGAERARPPLQLAADERRSPVRRDASDRTHPRQRTDAEHVYHCALRTHGHLPELHRRLRLRGQVSTIL